MIKTCWGRGPSIIMNEKTRAQFFNDPIYGPNGPFFWPGTTSDAREFVMDNQPIDRRSTACFLEDYQEDFSGVECYIANTEHPGEKFIDKMRADFHKLYHGIESWPYHTFFVSAFYRIVFHDIFPYQSKRYEAIRNRSIDLPDDISLRERLYDEAIRAEFLQSLEKIQQDKEIDKVGGRISETTWDHLVTILRDPESDSLVCKELIRLVKQYNLTDAYPEDFKSPILLRFKHALSQGWVPPAQKSFTEGLLACLSLLRIPTEKNHQAITKSLAEKSYAPLIDLLEENY